MPDQLHSLLKRQLKRHFGPDEAITPEWRAFVAAVNQAYRQFDDDRRLLERSLELTSQELIGANSEMRVVFERLINSSADGILAFDTQCRYLVWNPAIEQLFGQRAADALGRRAADVLPNFVASGEDLLYQAALAGHTTVAADRRYTLPGSEQPGFFEGYYSPLFNESGTIIGGLAIIRDITERKRVEAELQRAKEAAEEASRAKSAFLANMSHELRTPLTAIIGYSELLLRESDGLGHAEMLGDLGKILSAGKHLLSLINDVLDFSKIEAGRVQLDLQTFDLAPLVDDVVTTMRPLAAENANFLRVELGAGLGAMHSDQLKIRQTLMNLLSNACKFTRCGAIVVTGEREIVDGAPWVRLTVADTGIGISEAQLGMLFQPFVQGDASTTRRYGGSGLGLAISQRFCQYMGGEITVKSALGQGAAFTVRLPAVLPVAAPRR
ncbi:MAG TPA: ATP-binding protein [Kouleothrix sp.]|uniref:PAS domain-containing sensor histidine kinase n=1 Tax=Kouleothrix sp. TaxID=2779161 RepID=UPI002C2CADF4|nr:ATP-binding protein [Kouleothrix sp.]HRC76476.1 ATP-binding protein [Kouleothrix sp.]